MKVEEMGAKTLSIATDSASIFTFGSAKPLAESFRFLGARPCGAPGFPLQFAASLRLHRGKAAALPCAFFPSAAHFRFNPSRLRKSAAKEASENYKYENNLI